MSKKYKILSKNDWITQLEKIRSYEHVIEHSKILMFLATKNLDRWLVKEDKKKVRNIRWSIYKANVYRTEFAFRGNPLYQAIRRGTKNYFFIAYSKNVSSWLKLPDIYKLPLDYFKQLFTVQKKTFLAVDRISLILTAHRRKHLAKPLAIPQHYILLCHLLKYLRTIWTIKI